MRDSTPARSVTGTTAARLSLQLEPLETTARQPFQTHPRTASAVSIGKLCGEDTTRMQPPAGGPAGLAQQLEAAGADRRQSTAVALHDGRTMDQWAALDPAAKAGLDRVPRDPGTRLGATRISARIQPDAGHCSSGLSDLATAVRAFLSDLDRLNGLRLAGVFGLNMQLGALII
jgi:hypothetical protein